MTEWAEVRALEPLHILRESVVRERFDYDDAPGVHVAFVRRFPAGPGLAFSRCESLRRLSQLGASCRSRRLVCGFNRCTPNERVDRRRDAYAGECVTGCTLNQRN